MMRRMSVIVLAIGLVMLIGVILYSAASSPEDGGAHVPPPLAKDREASFAARALEVRVRRLEERLSEIDGEAAYGEQPGGESREAPFGDTSADLRENPDLVRVTYYIVQIKNPDLLTRQHNVTDDNGEEIATKYLVLRLPWDQARIRSVEALKTGFAGRPTWVSLVDWKQSGSELEVLDERAVQRGSSRFIDKLLDGCSMLRIAVEQ